MGISILVRQHGYIKMAPSPSLSAKKLFLPVSKDQKQIIMLH